MKRLIDWYRNKHLYSWMGRGDKTPKWIFIALGSQFVFRIFLGFYLLIFFTNAFHYSSFPILSFLSIIIFFLFFSLCSNLGRNLITVIFRGAIQGKDNKYDIIFFVGVRLMATICLVFVLYFTYNSIFHYSALTFDILFNNSIGLQKVNSGIWQWSIWLFSIVFPFEEMLLFSPSFRKQVYLNQSNILAREHQLEQLEKHRREFDQDKSTYMQTIKHELGNKIPAIRNQFADLSNALQRFSQKKQFFDLTMKIREPIEGENERDIDSFKDVLKRLEDTLTYTGNMIDSMESVITMDQESMKLESKHIIGFLKKLEKSVKHKFSHIDIDTKFEGYKGAREPWHVDPIQFKLLYDNFIQNSIKHGFRNDEKHMILIIANKTETKVELKLLNNGKPKPKDLSIAKFIEYKYQAGETGNTGIGGFAIGRVVHNHNGSIDFIEDFSKFPLFSFGLSVVLPREPKKTIEDNDN